MPDKRHELELRLRAELAERPVESASQCPSWPSYLRRPHAEAATEQLEQLLSDALSLALASPRTRDYSQRLRAAVRAVLRQHPDIDSELCERMWNGELGWSAWLGPFVLACVPPPQLEPNALRTALGPLARFLLPERLIDNAGLLDWLVEIDTPGRLALAVPAQARAPLHARLVQANHALHGEQAIEGSALEQRWVHDFLSHWEPPDPAPGCAAVVALAEHQQLHRLHQPTIEELSSVVYLGASELLEVPLPSTAARSWPAPAPLVEARRRELQSTHAATFDTLERELAARPLSEAASCPSWVVLVDLLLASGDALLAEWLQAALDDPAREAELGHELTRGPFSHPRKHLRYDLHKLWKQRGQLSHWFGPFVLRYFDPWLRAGLGARDVQQLLGVHAALLPHSRIYTRVESEWIDDVLRARSAPLLAPLPNPQATVLVAHLLVALFDRELRMHGSLRMATPGQVLAPQPERSFMTNIGPVAADSDATAVLCCETPEDLARHAERLAHLDTFAHVIVLGTAQLLAQWPHTKVTLREWGEARRVR